MMDPICASEKYETSDPPPFIARVYPLFVREVRYFLEKLETEFGQA